jgi:tetratricopeptide (TPR) repeat protein
LSSHYKRLQWRRGSAQLVEFPPDNLEHEGKQRMQACGVIDDALRDCPRARGSTITRHEVTMQTDSRQSEIAEAATQVAVWMREGSLRLRDLVGLTDQELQAVTQVAESLRRRGSLPDAVAVHGLLIIYEPLRARHWQAMADLQRRLGQPAMAAVCYEVLALLAGRDAEATYRQALCLEQLGQTELARNLLDLALTLAEQESSEPSWAPKARRTLEREKGRAA